MSSLFIVFSYVKLTKKQNNIEVWELATESSKKRLVDFQEISQDSDEVFDIMLEYMKLKISFSEPLEAELFRKQAESFLGEETRNYETIKRLMVTALKIMKACHHLN